MSIFAERQKVKTRYFIFISFRGSSYHGWQIQPNAVTIQGRIEEALSVILGEKINLTGSGRTDTGVHAVLFVAHFESSIPHLEKNEKIVYSLNSILPADIAVNSIKKVRADAHARFSAISRTYKYYITGKKDPFSTEFSWYLPGKKDIKSLNKACEILTAFSDFKSFSRLHSNNKTTVCKIFEAKWEEENDKLVFTIRADRFLRNMVRAIVGTIINIGMNKMSLKEFEEIIQVRDRNRAGQSAVAKGLFLVDIEYPPEIFYQ